MTVTWYNLSFYYIDKLAFIVWDCRFTSFEKVEVRQTFYPSYNIVSSSNT